MFYRGSQTGFTLLEIVIILVLLGFMAGLALPRLERVYSGMQQSMQRNEALRCIADLGFQAFSRQQQLALTRYPAVADNDAKHDHPDVFSFSSALSEDIFPLPENWSVEAEKPIIFQANGICSGGTIILRYDEMETRYILAAPFCTPMQTE